MAYAGMSGAAKHDAKVVILGASGVGKTCIGLRFVKDQFVTYTASTIGASFLVKELALANQRITLQIWDTAGQERFRSMAPLYYRGAHAAHARGAPAAPPRRVTPRDTRAQARWPRSSSSPSPTRPRSTSSRIG